MTNCVSPRGLYQMFADNTMRSTLETSRTILRPFALRDAHEAFSWFNDPDVMRYIPLGADSTVEETVSRINRYIEHQNSNGFSKWVIIDRQTQRLIGDSGFYLLPEGKGVELGYRLSRAFWGKGLATEVAKRWIEAASDFISAPSIFAFAHPENSSSFRVIHKLGFQYLRHEVFYGLKAPLYELPLTAINGKQRSGANS